VFTQPVVLGWSSTTVGRLTHVFIPTPSTPAPVYRGHIGPRCEDFCVDEVSAYPLDGEGEHWFVRLKKRALNTADLVRIVARAASVRERDLGVAGQKDKQAVTTQWLSTLVSTSVPPSEWQLPAGIEVVEVTKHRNKLRTGHLDGNRFRIRLVGDPAASEQDLAATAARLVRDGVPNYYGAQRFGFGQTNLSKALEWLKRQTEGGARGSRFVAKWMPSVIQAEVFNRYLAARIALGTEKLLVGEIVRLNGSSRHFEVDDPESELPRLQTRDIFLSGPMIGPKTRNATREAMALEQHIVAELGLDDAKLAALAKQAPGARRDLFVFPEDLTVTRESDGSVVLQFAYPAGAYATGLVAEFTHAAFGQERLASTAGSDDGEELASEASDEG
jgi:tRNA pseudouridine13 synthase